MTEHFGPDEWISIDASPCAHCCDLGQGYSLALAIGPGGEVWPFVHDSRVTGTTRMPLTAETFRHVAPHDVLDDRRPPPLTRALTREQPRCGRRRYDGGICRSPVARPGAACHWHRGQRPAEQEAHR